MNTSTASLKWDERPSAPKPVLKQTGEVLDESRFERSAKRGQSQLL